MKWRRLSGPSEVDQVEGYDMARAWDYVIARGDEVRDVTVIVAASIGDNPVDESREAITSYGRSTLRALLDLDDPPRYVVITTSGIREDR